MEKQQNMQYFMCLKSKQIFKTQFVPPPIHSLTNSWEEQAFAEDISGHLGGFVWPPRCYSCAFCTRKFKSAQALGGHMNVHRRERARLKQGLDLGFSSSSASRVSPENSFTTKKQQEIPTTSDDSSKCPINVLNLMSSELKEGGKEVVVLNDRESTETLMELKEGSKEAVVLDDRESTETLTAISDDTNLSVGLSLGPEKLSSLSYRHDDEENIVSTKRQRKRNDVTTVSFFKKSCYFQSKVVRIKNNSSVLEESIDLELRLGV